GPLRYVWVYPDHSPERVAVEEAFLARSRGFGVDVEGFGIPCPGGWWPFPQLDERWRAGDPGLLQSYERLFPELAEADVLVASGGAMLHPEFLAQLHLRTVFLCADDPESSAILSRPVAPCFDVCLPMNIGCLDDYRRWGCRHVAWLHHAVRPEWREPAISAATIRGERRPVDVV